MASCCPTARWSPTCRTRGSWVSVRACIEQTPVQVRPFYGEEPGLELFEIEDEIYEAEVL